MKLYFTRSVVGWALYDFANSAFATTILSVIFNVYFVKVICGGGVPVWGHTIPGEAFWGYTVSASMLIVFFLAPILGAVADLAAAKKKFLFFFWLVGCLFTGMLFWCMEGDHWLAASFFIIANIGFAAGNVFYNALLPDISTPETVGRISGFGWAMGYLGGGLLLALNLLFLQHPEWFRFPTENHLPVRISIFSVALWWAVFSIPVFLWVREKTLSKPIQKNVLKIALKNVLETFRKMHQHKEIFKYLLAYLIYNDGIETVILMASIFGAKEIGMSQSDLILCFLMIQAVAFFGALIFGYLADRFAHKISISMTLWIYIAVCLWATVMRTKFEFWILGGIVGVILGGSQSASRSLLALLVPEEESAQFFGFSALTEKLSTVIGPFVFGLLTQLYSLRVAVGSLALFFAVGLTILHFVREPEKTGFSSLLPR